MNEAAWPFGGWLSADGRNTLELERIESEADRSKESRGAAVEGSRFR